MKNGFIIVRKGKIMEKTVIVLTYLKSEYEHIEALKQYLQSFDLLYPDKIMRRRKTVF